jgi:glycosyltransferase involved in cell wall biosynthesis
MSKVSVIIPTFNRAGCITKAVDSVLAQTYPNYEIIVVDDGSTHNTREVLQPYLDRIHYIFQPNAGVSAARNTGIRAASSDLIAFLDSDDKWLPRKLEVQLPLMADERVVLSFTNLAVVDSRGNRQHGFETRIKDQELITSPLALIATENHPWVHLGASIVRHSVLRKVGMFNERIRVAEDSQLIYRLAFEGCFAATSEILYELNRDERLNRLTQVGDKEYTNEVTAAAVEVFMEAYARASTLELAETPLIRQRLAKMLVKQAICFAKIGSYSSARRRGFEALVFGARGGAALRAAVTFLCPHLYRTLARKRHNI